LPAWTVTTNNDEYRSFVIPAGASAGKYLNKIEYLPGNNAIVHHVVIWADPTNISSLLDAADPLPGFASSGTMPPSLFASLIGAWAPGSGNFELPANMGIFISSNYDYVVELHYAPNSLAQVDSTTINFTFTTQSNIRPVSVDPILEYFFGMVDGPLFIPANTVQTFHEKFELDNFDASLIGTFPHMHLFGKHWKSWALNQAGDTTRLISIPKWDFHWQGFYFYQKLIPVFDGSSIWGQASFDNTSNNPDNPNDPPQDVSAGEQTTDEMMIGFFAYTEYQPGDEDVVLDSTILETVAPPLPLENLLELYPNPAADEVFISVHSFPAGNANLEIYNSMGKQVLKKSIELNQQGISKLSLDVSSLEMGYYQVKVAGNGKVVSKSFIKSE
jgi:hypothetical protein